MLCCSNICEKSAECARYFCNYHGTEIRTIENLYDFGSCTISSNGIILDNYWCGPQGNYGMFEMIEVSR